MQVGGNHYQLAIQPIDYILKNGLGFCEGNIIKYVTRHRSKGGREDLLKARHYLDLLLEHEYAEEKAPPEGHFGTVTFRAPSIPEAEKGND